MRLMASCGGFGAPGIDRPVDQRKERQFVVGGIDADRLAGFQRGALRQEQGQPGHARLDDGIDVGVAGDHIGEVGLRHRLDGEIVVVVGAERRRRQRQQGQRDRQRGRHRAPPQQGRDAAAEHRHDDGIDQEQRQRGDSSMPRRSRGSLLV